jgi:phytoene synthase
LERNAPFPYTAIATRVRRHHWPPNGHLNPPASKQVLDSLAEFLILPVSTRGSNVKLRGILAKANRRESREILWAYDACKEIIRKHSKSFYLSARFLPPAKRQGITALYAFCRISDDLVDGSSPVPSRRCAQDDLCAALDRWSALVSDGANVLRHPVATAWADTRARFAIPSQLAEELLSGIRMDLTIDRYETWDDLWVYCYKVASTVGLMSMYITGAGSMAAVPYAVQLGVALQLTNILRDVGEDAQSGRVYLPAEDMDRFGYTEAMLFDGVVNRNFINLIEFQMARAEALYKCAMPGISMLPRDSRLAVTAAATLYKGILGQIRGSRYDVFTRRAHVSTRGKLCAVPGIWLSSRR